VSKNKISDKERSPRRRFGIGEWYGKSFAQLTSEDRRFYAKIQLLPKAEKPAQPCPFLSDHGRKVNCWKPGGICSLRSYEESVDTKVVSLDSRASTIRTTCPSRFEEGGTIYRWIGETILGDEKAVPVGETPFLERAATVQDPSGQALRKVGRIDNVLVLPGSDPLQWCPIEKQAVYFSGERMEHEFRAMAGAPASSPLPFPLKNRRPDYRSSGPKRLLPQLEIKVPTLSTWGKKMAVVVDEDFFSQLGHMREANDLSNAELAWFIVKYADEGENMKLQPGRVSIIRLKDAIEGLVAAVPIPKPQFEEAIRSKLLRITLASRDSDPQATRS
jgi:hypothetical protein